MAIESDEFHQVILKNTLNLAILLYVASFFSMRCHGGAVSTNIMCHLHHILHQKLIYAQLIYAQENYLSHHFLEISNL